MAKNLILVNKTTGLVDQIVTGFDDRTYQPSVYSQYVPYVMDDSISCLNFTETVETGNQGNITNRALILPPVTEQRLIGTLYGNYVRGELLFQSTLHPTVINNLVFSGRTAAGYNPTVVTGVCVSSGTIVGEKCARFMGSYLDTDTQAACIRIPDYTFPGSCLPYYMVSGFVYMDSTPSAAYDPIVVAKTTSATAGTVNDTFQYEYDNSATRMLLMVSSNSYSSTGYEYTINASPTGVTLNRWHHFAFAYSNQGNSACVSTYWNGIRIAKQTGISGNIRFNSAPFSIGGGPYGDKPFKGYMDDLIVSGGTSSTALRGVEHGTTCPVPTESQSSGQYTIFHTTFHGPVNTSLFPVSGPSKVLSSHIYNSTNPETGLETVYVGGIDAVQDSVHGLDLFTGISSGYAVYVSGGSAGYVFGYDSGACLIPTTVDQLIDLPSTKNMKSSLVSNTFSYLLGSTAMRGNSGRSGDFPRLFQPSIQGASPGYPPNKPGMTGIRKPYWTFLPTKQSIEDLRTLYDGVTGRSGGTYFVNDADGTPTPFTIDQVTALYFDVANYYAISYQDTGSIQSEVAGSSTFSDVRQVGGYNRSSFVQKLSAQVGIDAPSFAIKPVSKTTKAYVAPENLLKIDIDQILPLEGDGAFVTEV